MRISPEPPSKAPKLETSGIEIASSLVRRASNFSSAREISPMREPSRASLLVPGRYGTRVNQTASNSISAFSSNQRDHDVGSGSTPRCSVSRSEMEPITR
jgi:hypothetical protein